MKVGEKGDLFYVVFLVSPRAPLREMPCGIVTMESGTVKDANPADNDGLHPAGHPIGVNGGAKLVHPGGAKLVHLTLCGTRCWGVVPVVHRRDPRCFV